MKTIFRFLFKQAVPFFLLLVANLVFVAGSFATASDSLNYQPVRNLDDKWQVYDSRFQGYVNYRPELHGKPASFGLWIDAKQDRYFIELQAGPGLCVYANRRLFAFFQNEGLARLNLAPIIDSLNTSKIFITLYQPSGLISINTSRLVNYLPNSNAANNTSVLGPATGPVLSSSPKIQVLQARPRKMLSMPTYCTVFILLISAFYVSLKSWSPGAWFQFFDFRSYLSADLEAYSVSNRKLGNTSSLILIVINTLAASVVFFLVQRSLPVHTLIGAFPVLTGFGSATPINLAIIVVLGLLYYFLKYLLVQLTGSVLNLGEMTGPHYFEFIRFSTFFGLLLMFFSVLVYTSHVVTEPNFIWLIRIMILFFFVLRQVKVSILLNSIKEFRYLYLFSYLCVTELVPMVFVMKMVVNY